MPLLLALSRPHPAADVACNVGEDDVGSSLLHLLCFSSSSWLWNFRARCPLFLFAGALGVSSVTKKNVLCVYMCVSLARIVLVILSVSFAGLSSCYHLCCDYRLPRM